ncbi:MAG: alanine racemase [Vulcanimicrobiaceae bacterium]
MTGSIEISLPALRRNARALASLIAPSKAAFVVKSNAYGHGIVETARGIEGLASHLCVYAVEEAICLRDAGITKPIIVLGPVAPEMLEAALDARAEIALWSTGGYLRALTAHARRRHTRMRVHVKLNTGLHRFGLEVTDAAGAIEEYLHLPELQLAGIFSHLAAAEELDSPYTMYQLQQFESALAHVRPIAAAHRAHIDAHLAASAAAMLWPQTRLDLARFGIALYGLWPSPQTQQAMQGSDVDLVAALSYRSSLVFIREVPAGAPIGYGCTYHAPHSMRIGVVPLGYADGIPRALSNTGAFLVGGARCPIIGRVAMNVTIVDLTAAPRAQVGSSVTLIGRDGSAAVTAGDWALWSGTISYEIVTRLPAEIPRRFVPPLEEDGNGV